MCRISDNYYAELWPTSIRPDAAQETGKQTNVQGSPTRFCSIANNLILQPEQLKQTIDNLVYWSYSHPFRLHDWFDTFQIYNASGSDSIYFTGYYSPTIRITETPSERFQYPIYRRPPEGQHSVSRKNIYEGALKDKQLEIGYAESLSDIYFMQVQGSGYAEFSNGKRLFLAYDGTNGLRYSSIGSFLLGSKEHDIKNISNDGIREYLLNNPTFLKEILAKDPSFTYFKPIDSYPRGATNIPLVADYSVAVDKNFLPLGACLLAKIPQKNKGEITYDYRILLTQDAGGGAVHGAGHLDVYCGVGSSGKAKADALHHYGELWLLLPKQENYVQIR